MILENKGTYQGLPILAVEYRRSEGLQPEPGWVEIDFKDLKKVTIIKKPVPWRGAGGVEFDSGASIQAWSLERPTVTTPAAVNAPEDGGLNPFGDLVLESVDEDGASLQPITYKDVQVDTGIEEVTEDLADSFDHDKGVFRIPLTDIRRFYADHGPFFGRINCRTKSGDWDKTTLKDGDSTPWSLLEVVQYFFSQLPGSPSVNSWSEIYGLQLDPPVDIVGRGEPVLQHLKKLLEFHGLTAQLQPDNNYVVNKRYSDKIKQGKVSIGGGQAQAGKHLIYEKKSSSRTGKPAACLVVGKKRVRPITLSYVPVLPDESGRIWRMADLLQAWGYPIDNLNAQVFATDKQFADVPPAPGPTSQVIHARRRKILSKAYRMYAPEIFFQTDGAGAGMTTTTVGIDDRDFEHLPFLPVKDLPIFQSKLAELHKKVPKDQLPQKGDTEKFYLMPPVIRASRVTQERFKDFAAIKRYFDGLIATYPDDVTALNDRLFEINKLISSAGKELQQVGRTLRASINAQSLAEWRTITGSENDIVGVDQLEKLLLEASDNAGVLSDTLRANMDEKAWTTLLRVKALIKEKAAINSSLGDLQTRQDSWTDQFSILQQTYSKLEFVPLRCNVAWTTLEDGVASIDPLTGILTSSVHLCATRKPFFIDGDEGSVIADGNVLVTYGYELNQGTMSDYTTVKFVASDDDPPKPKVTSVSTCGPIKPRVFDSEIQLFEDSLGTTMNLNAVVSAALGAIGDALTRPLTVDGFTAEYHGLRAFYLDGGVQSVQHVWHGDEAKTILIVNNYGGRGPLGPPGMKNAVETVDYFSTRRQSRMTEK